MLERRRLVELLLPAEMDDDSGSVEKVSVGDCFEAME